MNKKIIVLIIAIVVILTIGVGILVVSSNNNKTESNNNSNTNITENGNSNETQEDKTQENQNNNKPANDKKIAIIYFSATGTTKKVAEYIKNATNGDLIEIVPKEKYTDNDLNYGNNNSRANKEQNDSNARPEISNNINTDSYDVIYLGYPIWWGDVPKIILTFLDNHNLNGKIVIPFCTSGSTGISGSLSTLKNYNKNINWIDGKRFSSSVTQDEISSWINGLDY